MHILAPASAGIYLTVSANASSYNLFQAAGSPVTAVEVTVTVLGEIVLGQFATGTGWHANAILKLVNYGKIWGQGGVGNGGVGGDAIVLSHALSIDNTVTGQICGGGGGGGYGRALVLQVGAIGCGGGGGGGGQGNPGGNGGAGNHIGIYAYWPAQDGENGDSSRAGYGGDGGGPTPSGQFGGSGAPGGQWGQNGLLGGANSDGVGGQAGGAAGYAVRRNGYTVTWIRGNNATQVKGTVA